MEKKEIDLKAKVKEKKEYCKLLVEEINTREKIVKRLHGTNVISDEGVLLKIEHKKAIFNLKLEIDTHYAYIKRFENHKVNN
jgi:hypothetical protein